MLTDVDTTQTTHISLCSGYGGIDLGLRRCIPGLRTVAYSEIEASAVELLLARMEGGSLDAAPIWTDLKSFPWRSFRGKVDILSGGYPCQPFSSAGKRAGKDDPRHLWPWIADGIATLQPRICFFENVEGHITLGLRDVLDDLGRMGYRTTWGIFSASEVGAPHQRKRVFVLAESSGIGGETGLSGSFTGNEGQSGVIDYSSNQAWPSQPGELQHAWEPPRTVRQTQPALGGDITRTSSGLDYGKLCISGDNRTDELRMLGNGVVPATAERAFRVLMQELSANPHP